MLAATLISCTLSTMFQMAGKEAKYPPVEYETAVSDVRTGSAPITKSDKPEFAIPEVHVVDKPRIMRFKTTGDDAGDFPMDMH